MTVAAASARTRDLPPPDAACVEHLEHYARDLAVTLHSARSCGVFDQAAWSAIERALERGLVAGGFADDASGAGLVADALALALAARAAHGLGKSG